MVHYSTVLFLCFYLLIFKDATYANTFISCHNYFKESSLNKKLNPQIKKILILTAMKVESRSLLENHNIPFDKISITVNRSKIDVYSASYKNREIFVVETGVGFVNSSIVISRMIDDFSIDAIISFGVGGSLSKDLKIGDAVISTSVIQHDAFFVNDESVQYMAPGKLFLSLAEDERDSAYIPATDSLLNIFRANSRSDSQTYFGVIASGSSFIGSYSKKVELNTHLTEKALLVDMEAAAIAQLSRDANVPFLIIKTVADRLLENGSIENDYKVFLTRAAENTRKFFDRLLESF